MGRLIEVGFDVETYYSTDYSLRKMTTAEYIRDPRFQVIGFSLLIENKPARWFTGTDEYLYSVISRIPWERCRLNAHNAIFDGAVLEWIFRKKPAAYFCTMMGSRPYVTPVTGKMSLASVLEYLDLGRKGNAVEKYAGMRREDFSSYQLRDYGNYCCGDTTGCMNIARQLVKWIPEDEQELIDLTIKKFTRPTLHLNRHAIQDRLVQIGEEKAAILKELKPYGVTATKLRSRKTFAGMLAARGRTPPLKPSPSNPLLTTYAFAKQDAAFVEMLADEDPVVRQLVEARLMFSSNLEETRLQTFDRIAALTPQSEIAVPLLWYGAHTGRMSGLDSLNMQNLPRPRKDKPSSGALRKCLVPPQSEQEVFCVVSADLSQIEARVLATLAGQHNLVNGFRAGHDVYCTFGTEMYGRKITKGVDDLERFVSKTCVLGLGFGMGAWKLRRTLALGIGGSPVSISEEEALRAVKLYRWRMYPKIREFWTFIEGMLAKCIATDHLECWGPLTFKHERIGLPNGMDIWYPGLDIRDGSLGYLSPTGEWRKLWGGIITENVVQALARIVISTGELRLARKGLRAALQVHDELVFVLRQAYVERCRIAIDKALTTPMTWMPALPLACEIKYGESYAAAK